MSDSDATPDWRSLPHRPMQFFQLVDGFDRKDLKRAYNKLLRIYKPDKHPVEFQKLRAAYEQLDTSLRYGGTISPATSSFATSWTNEAAPSQSDPRSRNRTSPDAQADDAATSLSAQTVSIQEQLVARLNSTPPVELYQELLKSIAESPFDFYARAILSDAVHENGELMFLKWILTGLKKYPEDSALICLLRAYFQSDQIADESLPNVLLTVSKVITTDRFYFFTERLFDRLCQCTSWKQFENVLDACRRNINDHRVQGSVVFTCHLLRRAAWLAPLEAAERLLAYLEEHSEFIGAGLEFDLEFNVRLLDYVRDRESFVKRGPTCTMIDEALRMFCLQPGNDADMKIVACQTHIGQNAESLFAELPFVPEGDGTKLDSWAWICEEVRERLETATPQPNSVHSQNATFKLLQQIDATFPSSQIQFYNIGRWTLSIVGYSSSVVIPLFFTNMVGPWLPQSLKGVDQIMFLVLLPVAALVFHFRIKPKTIDQWSIRYLHKLIYRNYRDWWRSMVARFHAATHLSYYEVRNTTIHLIYVNQGKLNVSTWQPQLYAVDSALMIYAAAVRFLR